MRKTSVWVGSLIVCLSIWSFAAQGPTLGLPLPASQTLNSHFLMLNQKTRVNLSWQPTQAIRVTLSRPNSPNYVLPLKITAYRSKAIDFMMPIPASNKGWGLSGTPYGWGGPHILTITDGGNKLTKSVDVLGYAHLNTPNRAILLVPPNKTIDELKAAFANKKVPLKIARFSQLGASTGPCQNNLVEVVYPEANEATGDFYSILERLLLTQSSDVISVNPATTLEANQVHILGTGHGRNYISQQPQTKSVKDIHAGGYNGNGAIIAVLDTGVTPTAELGDRLLPGKQFSAAGESADVTDDYTFNPNPPSPLTTKNLILGHGTLVASMAAGTQYGVAPGAEVLPVKVCDKDGFCRASDVIRGICWAMNKADKRGKLNKLILNLSLGGDTGDYQGDILKLVLQDAIRRGVNVVASAGNDWRFYDRNSVTPPRSYPAAYNLDGLMAVGASQTYKAVGSQQIHTNVAWYSNRGAWVDIIAPGTFIEGIDVNGQAENRNIGTSFAAPQVAGALALWQQKFPTATPAQLQQIVVRNANTTTIEPPAPSQYDPAPLNKLLDFTRGPCPDLRPCGIPIIH